jgi:CheY-like chemotaxis protein
MTKPMKCGSSGAGSSFFSLASSANSTTTTAAVRPVVQAEQASKTKKLDNPSSITLPIEDSPSGHYESPESCKEGQSNCKNDAVAPAATTTVVKVVDEPALTLPATMNVLFVDDDRTLRKLARRCLTRLVPAWNVWEASSGEMALSMIMSKDEHVAFDIIFMDQYMTTSAGQALKGTETTRQLRALGFSSPIICGLSANYDSKAPFLNCGADEFWLKPFPCALPELQRSLQNLVALRKDANSASDR